MHLKKILFCILSILLMSNFVLAAPSKYSTKSGPKKFDPAIVEICRLLENGNYRSADDIIYVYLQKTPTDPEVHILSAISLAMQDRIDSAQEELNSVKPVSLNNSDYYYAQGVIYLKRIDTSDMRFRTKTDDLIQLTVNQFKYSVKLDPKNDRAYNALGVAELKRDNTFRAETYFKEAIKINPSYATALDNLGSIYYIISDIDSAEGYYKKALAINPSSSTIYYHLSQVALKRDDLQSSLYYANKSLLWNKKSPYTYNLLGEIYKKQGNEAAAINSFKKSISAMPEYAAPYMNLASIYETRGDMDFAVEQLKTCYSVNPFSDENLLDLADLLVLTGQYQDAVKYYSQVSNKYKKESVEGIVTAYYGLSADASNKSLFRSNQYLNDAVVYINHAIEANPDNLELYLTKAKLVKMSQNPVESNAILEKIVSAPNSNLGDLIIKGDAYTNLEQYKDANSVYEEAVKSPKSVSEDLYLAELFTYNKQYKLAEESLNNVLAVDPDNSTALNNIAFIHNSIAVSDANLKNAKYFKLHNDKFFQKVYLNKAIKSNPNNIEANMMLGKILKRENDFAGANKFYKTVLGTSDSSKQLKAVDNITADLDGKIAKLDSKKLEKEQKTLAKLNKEKSKQIIDSQKNVEKVNIKVDKVQNPVEEGIKPLNNIVKPVDSNLVKPVINTVAPVIDTVKPAVEVDTPAADSVKPALEVQTPANKPSVKAVKTKWTKKVNVLKPKAKLLSTLKVRHEAKPIKPVVLKTSKPKEGKVSSSKKTSSKTLNTIEDKKPQDLLLQH